MSYQDIFARANSLYSSGAYNQAEQLYRQILEINPQNPDILNMLGLIAQNKNLHDQAVEYFYAALKSAPAHLPLYFNLAVSLAANGKKIEAVNAYLQVIKLNPNLKEAYNNLGGLYEQLGQKDNALEAYQHALSLDNQYLEPAVNMAVLQQDKKALNNLVLNYPHAALPLYYLALTEFKQDNLSSARLLTEKALTLDENSFEIRLLAGQIALKNKEYSKAAAWFQQTVFLNPKCVPALTKLAALEKNEALFKQALDIEPQNLDTHADYAAFLYEQKRFLEALEEYRCAVRIDPNRADLSNNLALILKDLGDYKGAIDLFLNAFISNPALTEISLNLAESLVLLERKDHSAALEIAQAWQKAYPKNAVAAHVYASFSGQNSETATAYSEQLFDYFADRYEIVMANLKYNIIQEIKKLNIEFKGHILDLGCGTGLAAQQFKTESNQFTGVDISQKMLEVARSKNLYHQLIKDDINNFLASNKIKYDFIIALDVFDYIDNIQLVFNKLNNTPLLFTIENASPEVETFALTSSGRYQHNPRYVKNLLTDNGYTNIKCTSLTLRNENGTPVEGSLFRAG